MYCSILISTLVKIIEASVSEHLSSDLSVNLIYLSVMDGPSTYRKSLLALILRVFVSCVNSKTSRTETTHGLTSSVARAIDITAWQSVHTVA